MTTPPDTPAPAPTRSNAETRAWLALLRAPGLGGVSIRSLVERAGSATAAVDTIDLLRREFAIDEASLAWLRQPDEGRLDEDEAWLALPRHHLLTWHDADYPPLLRDTAQPPAALFVIGEPGLLWVPQIGVVGARSATAGGLANARSFARSLAQGGFAITSGLADGVDGAAHLGALEAPGTTIAVMGTGPDLVYPRKHAELAGRIGASGVIVTEFPPGTDARPGHFPRRNRLIAGLSLGVLVIEAGLKSGSLITARLAAEQGREVFALPGSIHNPLARGCHQLIRQGAKLVEASEEIVAELAPMALILGERLRARLAPAAASPVEAAGVERDADYVRLLAALGHDPLSLDELADRAAMSISALSSMLLVLELQGEVVSAGGGRYMRS
ncbi:DNA-processing protein DprA [Tahibacter amnicola]|uniref:DNA-processing protein DprA n=1 Tax=Tahibacter amnicola TaxID=2976241 RepID=A0ABY6BCP5_9GAMM|nr:DNA-processing protein DprA [Tahibacter amnicola]UXI67819.1 DNA-processing protein DprA [Tahibacter amnicola]